MVQNCAARLLFNKKKFEHVTCLLVHLHCLTIKQRIIFKILVTTRKALSDRLMLPTYSRDMTILDLYDPLSRCY